MGSYYHRRRLRYVRDIIVILYVMDIMKFHKSINGNRIIVGQYRQMCQYSHDKHIICKADADGIVDDGSHENSFIFLRGRGLYCSFYILMALCYTY